MKAERKEWTLQEWLDNFQIEKYEQESITWNELLMGIAKVTAMMPIDKITPHIIKSMFMALYLHYDPNGDFVSQVKENHTLLDKIFFIFNIWFTRNNFVIIPHFNNTTMIFLSYWVTINNKI